MLLSFKWFDTSIYTKKRSRWGKMSVIENSVLGHIDIHLLFNTSMGLKFFKIKSGKYKGKRQAPTGTVTGPEQG